MDLMRLFRNSYLLALLVLQAACGNSEEVYIAPLADNLSGIVSQSTNRVKMATSTCGTAPTTNVDPSYDIDTPTIITLGQVVSGNVFVNSNKRIN